MNLGMAVWMEQYAVFGMVRAAVCAPYQMMAMPASQLREALLADRTAAVLLLPQTKQIPSALQIVCHTYAQPGFKVRFPLRIIRIGLALDFRMPTNRHTGGAEQAHVLLCPIGTRDVTKEHPVIPVFGLESTCPESNGEICAGVSAAPTATAG